MKTRYRDSDMECVHLKRPLSMLVYYMALANTVFIVLI